MLLPALRRLWRDEKTLQLGVDPAHALVIEVADPAIARVLDLLDGSRTLLGVQKDAAAFDVSNDTVTELVETLRDANLLLSADELLPASMTEPVRRRLWPEAAALALAAMTRSTPAPVRLSGAGSRVPRPQRPAEALRRRDAASVLVNGASRLASPLASILAASGVGHVDTAASGRVGPVDLAVGGVPPADLERPRRVASVDAVLRAAPETDTRAMRDGAPTFVVQIGQTAPAELVAFRYARQELPHLLIEERDGVILVGPLVSEAGRPCLNCVDLHRRDRDPAWPAMIAQLSTGAEAPFATSMVTTMIAAGVAAGQVLAYIDVGSAAAVGASFEINGTVQHRRRAWTVHPRCDCATRKRRRRGGMRRSSVG